MEGFEEFFSEFLKLVRRYNKKQRADILELTKEKLIEILAAFPVPEEEEGSTQSNAQPTQTTQQALRKKKFIELQLFIGDKLYTLGVGRKFWLRYDRTATGTVTIQEFDAAIAELGLVLTDDELALFQHQYDAGDGRISYDEFLKYVKAKQHEPRSSSQSLSVMAGRPTVAEKPQVKSDPSKAARIADGLDQMRERIASRNIDLRMQYKILKSAEGNGQVPVEKVAALLPSLGFPEGVASTQDLCQILQEYSRKQAGYVGFREFQSFFEGNAPPQPENPEEVPLAVDQGALLQVLVKLNNLNLRKVWKELDSDHDGLISVEEVSSVMASQGLPSVLVGHPQLRELIARFSNRKKGFLSYAEFIRFVNFRPGQNNDPQSSGHNVQIPADASLSQAWSLLMEHTKDLSLEQYFRDYEQQQGVLELGELGAALKGLGFELEPRTLQVIFNAFDHEQNGRIKDAEFARCLLNPNRNPKLGGGWKALPGGDSSVPLGSYAEDPREEAVRKPVAKFVAPPGGQSSVHLEFNPAAPTPPRVSNAQPSKAKLAIQGVEDDEIRFGLKPIPGAGKSSIVISDEIQPQERPNRLIRDTAGGGKTNWSLEFDPQSGGDVPKPVVKPLAAPGGNSSFSLAPTAEPTATPVRPSTAVLQQPGGNSRIFQDEDVARPTRAILAAPGGNSTLVLGSDGQPKTTTGPPKIFDLYTPLEPGSASLVGNRALKPLLQSPGGHDSVQLKHNVERPERSGRKPAPSTLFSEAPKNDDDEDGVDVDIDSDLLDTVIATILSKGRSRQTFAQLNKNKSTPLLSKQDFKDGVTSWGVGVSDSFVESVYLRFDKDLDGMLTYTEFVRLLATPPKSNNSKQSDE